MNTEHCKSRLLNARAQLLALQATRDDFAATVVLDQTSVGRLSRMDALQQQAMALVNHERAQRELLRIEAALRRCDEGRYGDCVECDEPIDPRRLEHDPATPLCVACAGKHAN